MRIVLTPQIKTKIEGIVSRGIKAAEIDENGHLIFTLTDNTTVDLGDVTGKTAFEAAVEGGFIGTEEQFNEALGKSFDAEAYGAGTRGGEAVEAGDPAYHNNAKYYAEAADTSAEAAGSAKTGAETAKSSAEAARDAATTAKNTAQSAATTAGNAAAAAAAAQSAAETAKTAAQAAKTAAEAAKTAAQAAQSAAETAQTGAEAAEDAAAASAAEIEDMTVSAHQVQAGGTPTVTKTGGSGGTPYNLDFGIPKGDKGDAGASEAEDVSYDNTTSGLDAANAQDAIDELSADLEGRAKFDGYYGESGGVFQYSTNFLGKNAPSEEKNIAFRPTASQMSGQAWTAHSISGQSATIDKIKGRTVVFNQLFDIASVSTTTVRGITFTVDAEKGTVTCNGTADETGNFPEIHCAIPHIKGHKYLILGTPSDGVNVNAGCGIWTVPLYKTYVDRGAGSIASPPDTESTLSLRVYVTSGVTVSNYVCHPQFFDLTQMFGAGNEPATVEEFKAMFPLEYYKYNTGELISLNATGLKTVGFNQWDEEWELGNISQGVKVPSTDTIRSKNYISILPNSQYYLKSPKYAFVHFLDANGDYISYTGSIKNGTFTTPANAHFCLFRMESAYGTTYNHDICINLSWSGIRNGEYERYWDSTLSLPITDYFPDGMKSAGTVYDELTKDKAVKRIGVVDLGTLNWTKTGSHRFYSTNIASLIKPSATDMTIANVICPNYTASNFSFAYDEVRDKIAAVTNEGSQSRGNLSIVDSSYSDAAAFKAAMSGVYLYYELAEPIETPISPPLNLTYRCDDFGTEMLLPQNDDEPVTAPMDADIVYQIDYEGNVRNMPVNTISKESMDAFIAAFNASGLGTITQTWDAANGRYAYTIAPPTPPTV